MLVTTGYLLLGGAAAAGTPAGAPPVTSAPVTSAAEGSFPADPSPLAAVARVDVAGVKLGMSADEVRAILKSKNLFDYRESAAPIAGTSFVNVIAAWTTLAGGDAEAYEVMFTPVPGKERAMAIVHSVDYSPAHGVREGALTGALLKKYGGYPGAGGLPESPTWRVQNDGTVLVGDSCKRRDLFGGLVDPGAGSADRPNLALKTTPDEFRYQIGECGAAIVTEDHATRGTAVPIAERTVTRYTVTAYSPSLGFAGATAASQWMQAHEGAPVGGAVPANAGNAASPKL
jgi:hypothetical protein